MLTRIAAVTAFVTAAVNVAVLFGWQLTPEQIAGINALVVAAGAAVHVWFNPGVKIGKQ